MGDSLSLRAGCYYRKTLSSFKHTPYAPTRTDEKIEVLRAFGAPGEMLSLSFSLTSSESIPGLELTSTSLEGSSGRIPESCLDLFIVKVWKQAGIGVYQSKSVMVPELLLKDDEALLCDGYTRRGSCGHWRHFLRRSSLYQPPDIRLEGNAYTTLAPGEPKQIWVSIRIPANATPGLYAGFIEGKGQNTQGPIHRLELQLEVLPIELLEPEQDLFIWYKGTLDCRRPQHYVREEIFRAQLQDIWDHGFRSISLNEQEPGLLQQALEIASSTGFKRNIVLTVPDPGRFSKVDFKGITPIYYVSDEMDARDEAFTSAHIQNWRTVQEAGGQTISSLVRQNFAQRLLDHDDIGCPPDIFSLYLPTNLGYFLARSEFDRLREVKTYYYWQSFMEKPDVHRVLAGLYLWKSKTDGIAPYCYQHLPAAPFSPFDDFDEWEPGFQVGGVQRPFKDHMTTYPARLGSIPTRQWKGLADGITDLKYLVTFESAIKRAQHQPSTEIKLFINEARTRCDRFLQRIRLNEINVNSEIDPEPYRGIRSEEYGNFREQLARDIVALSDLMARPAASD